MLAKRAAGLQVGIQGITIVAVAASVATVIMMSMTFGGSEEAALRAKVELARELDIESRLRPVVTTLNAAVRSVESAGRAADSAARSADIAHRSAPKEAPTVIQVVGSGGGDSPDRLVARREPDPERCSFRGDVWTSPTNECVCAHGRRGKYCEENDTEGFHSAEAQHTDYNLEKYERYTKKHCTNKLSMSGYWQDEHVMAQTRHAVETIMRMPKSGWKAFDACLGCGGFCRALERLGYKVECDGIDISPHAAEFVRSKVDGHFYTGDSRHLKFIPDDTYDVATATFCLNNIAAMSHEEENDFQACVFARELFRVVKPGGWLFFGTMYERDCPDNGHDVEIDFTENTCLPGLLSIKIPTVEITGEDKYCKGTMKDLWFRVPLDKTGRFRS